jgi:hypothetical protein
MAIEPHERRRYAACVVSRQTGGLRLFSGGSRQKGAASMEAHTRDRTASGRLGLRRREWEDLVSERVLPTQRARLTY